MSPPTVAESPGVYPAGYGTRLRRPADPGRRPNILMIVLDDVGFAQFGCFGSDIRTPTFDRLAGDGLRYNNFHVTSICSSTRASLLTGMNHHAVGMGALVDHPIDYPGYTGRIPDGVEALPATLRRAGYSTFAVGKWHLIPRWDTSAVGPFDRWPLGLGFERFYGFLGGETNQWAPTLVRDNQMVDQPRRPEEGYHLSEDLADTAIGMILDQQHVRPDKPFFCYLAPGAMHAPHQVTEEWSDPYRGAYDRGWDDWRDEVFAKQQELGVVPAGSAASDRPSWVQSWDSLSPDERRLFARMHEVYAGFMTHTDHCIGRIVATLEELGILDDTVIVVTSDNGASAEGGDVGSVNEHRLVNRLPDDVALNLAHLDELGGHRVHNHYPWGWAWAGNTPFRLWKRYTWLGGTRVPFIVRWGAGVEQDGQVRSQFCHAVDIMPTLCELAGAEPRSTLRDLDGTSFAATLRDGAAETRTTQYFEMYGSRALYHDGWRVVTDHMASGFAVEDKVEGSRDFGTDHWSLFDTAHDFAEANDLAETHPERAEELVRLWWAEAGRNNVLPMLDVFGAPKRDVHLGPSPMPSRQTYVYRPGGSPVPERCSAPLAGGFTVSAVVHVGDEEPSGILCAQGNWNNGWALLVVDGDYRYVLNRAGSEIGLGAPCTLGRGRHELGLEYRCGDGDGRLTLRVDGEVVAERGLSESMPRRWQIGDAPLSIGRDSGFPVTPAYRPPFTWNGTIETVTFEVADPEHGTPSLGSALVAD
ncbi:arylsulfatase [Pseudonocardia ailaonensis]|uniref:Arylsulfatase n=1 Tax=Pseudonocardia ailaonensis TaxID=367279 RepID=A0ABN2MZ28_9PSEU